MAIVDVRLKVLSHKKKSVKESFQLREVPKFSSVSELKNFIISPLTARLKILELGFTALREGHALLLRMKPPWLRRTRRKKINGWRYGHGAHLVTSPKIRSGTARL